MTTTLLQYDEHACTNWCLQYGNKNIDDIINDHDDDNSQNSQQQQQQPQSAASSSSSSSTSGGQCESDMQIDVLLRDFRHVYDGGQRYRHCVLPNRDESLRSIKCFAALMTRRANMMRAVFVESSSSSSKNGNNVVSSNSNDNHDKVETIGDAGDQNGMARLMIAAVIPLLETVPPATMKRVVNMMLKTLKCLPRFALMHESTDSIEEWCSVVEPLCDDGDSDSSMASALSLLIGLACAHGNIGLLLRYVRRAITSCTPVDLSVFVQRLDGVHVAANLPLATPTSFRSVIHHASERFQMPADCNNATLPPSHGNDIWGNPITETLPTPPSYFNSVCTDGRLVYVCNDDGVFSIGTGFGDTVSGFVYQRNEQFAVTNPGAMEEQWYLLWCGGKLFLSPSSLRSKDRTRVQWSNMQLPEPVPESDLVLLELHVDTLELVGAWAVCGIPQDKVRYRALTSNSASDCVYGLRCDGDRYDRPAQLFMVPNRVDCYKLCHDSKEFQFTTTVVLAPVPTANKRSTRSLWKLMCTEKHIVRVRLNHIESDDRHRPYHSQCAFLLSNGEFVGSDDDGSTSAALSNSTFLNAINMSAGGGAMGVGGVAGAVGVDSGLLANFEDEYGGGGCGGGGPSDDVPSGEASCYDYVNNVVWDYEEPITLRLFECPISDVAEPVDDVTRLLRIVSAQRAKKRTTSTSSDGGMLSTAFVVGCENDVHEIYLLLNHLLSASGDANQPTTMCALVYTLYIVANQVDAFPDNVTGTDSMAKLRDQLIEVCENFTNGMVCRVAIRALLNGAQRFWCTPTDWNALLCAFSKDTPWARQVVSDSLSREFVRVSTSKVVRSGSSSSGIDDGWQTWMNDLINREILRCKRCVTTIRDDEPSVELSPLVTGACTIITAVLLQCVDNDDDDKCVECVVRFVNACNTLLEWVVMQIKGRPSSALLLKHVNSYVRSSVFGVCLPPLVHTCSSKRNLKWWSSVRTPLTNVCGSVDAYNCLVLPTLSPSKSAKLIEKDLDELGAVESRTIESSHPQRDKQYSYTMTMPPSVACVILKFDNRSETRGPGGALSIRDLYGKEMHPKLADNETSPSTIVVVAGSVVLFTWKSDPTFDNDDYGWGFKCVATGLRRPSPFSAFWSLDLQMSLSHCMSVGIVCHVFCDAHRKSGGGGMLENGDSSDGTGSDGVEEVVAEEEDDDDREGMSKWLCSELFVDGMGSLPKRHQNFVDMVVNGDADDLVTFMRKHVGGRPLMAEIGRSSIDTTERYILVVMLYHTHCIDDAMSLSNDLSTSHSAYERLSTVWSCVHRQVNMVLTMARLQKRWLDVVADGELGTIALLDSENMSLLCNLLGVHFDELDVKQTVARLGERLVQDVKSAVDSSWVGNDHASWLYAYDTVSKYIIDRARVLLQVECGAPPAVSLQRPSLRRSASDPSSASDMTSPSEVLVLGRSLSFHRLHTAPQSGESDDNNNFGETEIDMKASYQRWKSWQRFNNPSTSNLVDDPMATKLELVSSFLLTSRNPQAAIPAMEERTIVAKNRVIGLEWLNDALYHTNSDVCYNVLLSPFVSSMQRNWPSPHFMNHIEGCARKIIANLRRSWFALMHQMTSILSRDDTHDTTKTLCIDAFTIQYTIEDALDLASSSVLIGLHKQLKRTTKDLASGVRLVSRRSLSFLSSLIAWWDSDANEAVSGLQTHLFDVVYDELALQVAKYLDEGATRNIDGDANSGGGGGGGNSESGDRGKDGSGKNDTVGIKVEEYTVADSDVQRDAAMYELLVLVYRLRTTKCASAKLRTEKTVSLLLPLLEFGTLRVQRLSLRVLCYVFTQSGGDRALDSDGMANRLLSLLFQRLGVLLSGSSFHSVVHKTKSNEGDDHDDNDEAHAANEKDNKNENDEQPKEERHEYELHVGDVLDALDTVNKWLPARVLEVSDDGREVLIHYIGWDSRWDERIAVDSDRLRRYPVSQRDKMNEPWQVKLHNSTSANAATLVSTLMMLGEEFMSGAIVESGSHQRKYLDRLRVQLKQSDTAVLYRGTLHDCRNFARNISQCGFTVSLHLQPLENSQIHNRELAKRNPVYSMPGYVSMVLLSEIVQFVRQLCESPRFESLICEALSERLESLRDLSGVLAKWQHEQSSSMSLEEEHCARDACESALSALAVIGGAHRCLHVGGEVSMRVGSDEDIRTGCLLRYERGSAMCTIAFTTADDEIVPMEVNVDQVTPIDTTFLPDAVLMSIAPRAVSCALAYVKEALDDDNDGTNNNNKGRCRVVNESHRLAMDVRLRCMMTLCRLFEDRTVCGKVINKELIEVLMSFATQCSPSSSHRALERQYARIIERFYDLQRPPLYPLCQSQKQQQENGGAGSQQPGDSSDLTKKLPFFVFPDSTTVGRVPMAFSTDNARFVWLEDDEKRVLHFTRPKNVRQLLSNIGMDSGRSLLGRSSRAWMFVADEAIPSGVPIYYFEVEMLTNSRVSIGVSPKPSNTKMFERGLMNFVSPSGAGGFGRPPDLEQLALELQVNSPGPEWQSGSVRYNGHRGTIVRRGDKRKDTTMYEQVAKFNHIGDVVGCGLDVQNDRLYFTHNGVVLEDFVLGLSDMDLTAQLYPAISVEETGTRVKINCGQEKFRCDNALHRRQETEEEREARIARAKEQELKRLEAEAEERARVDAMRVAEEASKLETATALMDIVGRDKLATPQQALKALEFNGNNMNNAAMWMFDNPQALLEIERSLQHDQAAAAPPPEAAAAVAETPPVDIEVPPSIGDDDKDSGGGGNADKHVDDTQVNIDELEYDPSTCRHYVLCDGLRRPSDELDTIHAVDPLEREWLHEIEGLLRQQGVEAHNIQDVMDQLRHGGAARSNAMLMLTDVIDVVPQLRRREINANALSNVRIVKLKTLRMGQRVRVCAAHPSDVSDSIALAAAKLADTTGVRDMYGVVCAIDKDTSFVKLAFFSPETSSLSEWWFPSHALVEVDGGGGDAHVGLHTMDEVRSVSSVFGVMQELCNVLARRAIVNLMTCTDDVPDLIITSPDRHHPLLIAAANEFLSLVDPFDLSTLYMDPLTMVPTAFRTVIENTYRHDPDIVLSLLQDSVNVMHRGQSEPSTTSTLGEIHVPGASGLIVSFGRSTCLPVGGVSIVFYSNSACTQVIHRFNGPIGGLGSDDGHDTFRPLVIASNSVWYAVMLNDNGADVDPNVLSTVILELRVCPLSSQFTLANWLCDYWLAQLDTSVEARTRLHSALKAHWSFVAAPKMPPAMKIIVFRVLIRGMLAWEAAGGDHDADPIVSVQHMRALFNELTSLYPSEINGKSVYCQTLLELLATCRHMHKSCVDMRTVEKQLSVEDKLTPQSPERDTSTKEEERHKRSSSVGDDELMENVRHIVNMGFSERQARMALDHNSDTTVALESLLSGDFSHDVENDSDVDDEEAALIAQAISLSFCEQEQEEEEDGIGNNNDGGNDNDGNGDAGNVVDVERLVSTPPPHTVEGDKDDEDDDDEKDDKEEKSDDVVLVYEGHEWFDEYCACVELCRAFEQRALASEWTRVPTDLYDLFGVVESATTTTSKDEHVQLLADEWPSWTTHADAQLVAFVESMEVSCAQVTIAMFEDASSQQNFPGLRSFSAAALWRRLRPIMLLNRYLESCLQSLDLTLAATAPQPPMLKWNAASVVTRNRHLILSSVRNHFFTFLLEKTTLNGNRMPRIVVDRLVAASAKVTAANNKNRVVQSSVFGQALRQLMGTHPLMLRPPVPTGSSPHIAFEVKFRGEAAVGEAGPYRQFFSDVCHELMEVYESETSGKHGQCVLPLFVQCANRQVGTGENRDKFVIRPSSDSMSDIAMFEFLGRLMGVAIRTNILMPLDLPSLFWKPLVYQEVARGDLVAVDKSFVSGVLDTIDACKDEDMFEEFFGGSLTYTIMLSDKTTVDLKPGKKKVEFEDAVEFVRLAQQTRLHEAELQVAAIRRGLADIVPSQLLCLCTWESMERRVCGRPYVDIDLLKRHTVYSSVSPDAPHIQYFWTVLEEWSQDERRKFIRFAWAQERLPSTDDEFRRGSHEIRFLIKGVQLKAHENEDDRFPRADTCFFNLELPKYSCLEVMRKKLNIVINLSSGMDADENGDIGRMDEELVADDDANDYVDE